MANLANRVVHFEISASDPERAIKFYTAVLGWEFIKWEGASFDYWMVMTGKDKEVGAINGGLQKRDHENPTDDSTPNRFTCVVEVEDVDAVAKAVKENGGKVEHEPNDLEGVGRLAYFIDTEGNHFGVIKSVQQN